LKVEKVAKQERVVKVEKRSAQEPLSPERPSKSLRPCLSSPSQILQLYSGTSSSSSHAKVMHFCTDMTNTNNPGGIGKMPS